MFLPSNIETIDFAALYREQKANSDFRIKNAEDWDKKAPSMANNLGGLYPKLLCDQINEEGSETLLDIGAGAGTIALPLAHRFKRIFAMDFSPKMLNALMDNAAKHGVNNIEPFLCDMEGDWRGVPIADIALASRSTEVSDMRAMLEKLNAHAKRRVYLTYKVGGSFLHAPILEAIGRKIAPKPDYIYAINILYNMGIYAELKFIESEGKGFNYHNETDYIKSVEWSIGELTEIEKEKLAAYFASLREKNELRDPHMQWALITWEKK